jgi:hypothetical protein
MTNSQTQSDDEHPFDVAKANNERVNEMLADTDGKIAAMEHSGAIGYHINVAKGETDPEYLWKIALLQALDDTVFEMLFVDSQNPSDARSQLEAQLTDSFDPFTAEAVADRFEQELESLIEVQNDQEG